MRCKMAIIHIFRSDTFNSTTNSNTFILSRVSVVMGRVRKSRVRVLKSQARSSPSLDSSSKIEYESAKKCRVRVESMLSLDLDPSVVVMG